MSVELSTKWYTVGEVAAMLQFGLSKTKQLVAGGEIRSVKVGGELVLGETKSEASDARLPLPDICIAALRLQQQWCARKRQSAGPYWVESGYVVTSATGGPMDPRNFHRAFQKRCDLAGARCPVHGDASRPLRRA